MIAPDAGRIRKRRIAAGQIVPWLVVSALTGACASGGFVRPTGAPRAAPDGASLWAEASSACTGLQAWQAQMRLSVRAGRRLPTVTAATVLTASGQIGLEARVAGSPVFVLRGRAEAATLVLSQERRVVTAPASEILDALVGVSLTPARLMQLLSGCLAPGEPVDRAESFDDGRVVAVHVQGGDVAYLVRDGGRVRLRGGDLDRLLVDYRWGKVGTWPAEVVMRTRPDRSPAVSITARLETVVVNPSIDARLFAMVVPEDARAMTLDELRASGPLGDDRRGG